MARSSSLIFAARLLLWLALMLFSGFCLARNFKYTGQLSREEYRIYKDGLIGGIENTLFMHYPAQVFSCDFPVNYFRFSDFVDGIAGEDVFERARTFTSGTEGEYFTYVSRELFDTWSSCYQNFITRYCMFIVTTSDRLFVNRIRMCKHMYFPKTPDNTLAVLYLVREVKPYINFHMREHIKTNHYAATFSPHGLYPLGLEYVFDWNYLGYESTPELAYANIKTAIFGGLSLYTERPHGPRAVAYARFTMLADSWVMKFIEMVHAALWTSVYNYRGRLTHELTNAYQDLEHIQLQYLTHMCAKLIERKKNPSSAVDPPDVVSMDMCPNPCRLPDICASRPHTSGSDCTPIGLGKEDFKCECMAGYAWNPLSLSCDESFDCNRDCHPANTRFCSFVPAMELAPDQVGFNRLNSREGHLRCYCYPELEGAKCDRPRNACKTGSWVGAPNGNERCRVDFGGVCTPTIGSSHYVCTCPKGYRSDKSLREDNCLARRTACDSVVCANNGACHSSTNGDNFECVCTPGFEGRLCEKQIVYQWTFWSDWSACDSLCGQGWQLSRRVCWNRQVGRPDARRRCPGNNQTLRVCHKHCLTEIQTSHYIAIGLLMELLFRMGLSIIVCFLFLKILFDMLFRESDYVFVRYLRTVLLDLVRRAVGARKT